jgi:hypothetical protein
VSGRARVGASAARRPGLARPVTVTVGPAEKADRLMEWPRAIRDAAAKADRDRVIRDVAADGSAVGRPGVVVGSQLRRRAATGARLARRGPGQLAGRAAAAGRCPGPTGALAWRAAITGLARAWQLVVRTAATAIRPASSVARRPVFGLIINYY